MSGAEVQMNQTCQAELNPNACITDRFFFHGEVAKAWIDAQLSEEIRYNPCDTLSPSVTSGWRSTGSGRRYDNTLNTSTNS